MLSRSQVAVWFLPWRRWHPISKTTPGPQSTATELFRSYLTPQQKREHTIKGYVTLIGEGRDGWYLYRLYPNSITTLRAVDEGSAEWNCCLCHSAPYDPPLADVALTILMYYIAGGIKGLQQQFRNSSHITAFPFLRRRGVVKAKRTRSA